MRMDAALPVADQWERDLAELLGLDGAVTPHVAIAARRSRRSLIVLIIGMAIATGLGIFLVEQRLASPRPIDRPIVRAVPERPFPAPVPTLAPAPPASMSQRESATDAAPTGGIVRSPSPGESRDAIASRSAVARGAPSAKRSDRSARVNQPPSDAPRRQVSANAVFVSRNAARGKTGSLDLPMVSNSSPGEVASPPINERRRASNVDRSISGGVASPPATRDVAASASEMPHDMPASARPLPGSPTQRDRSGRTEAIDAIRQLRRQ